jgi:hypothetical protein
MAMTQEGTELIRKLSLLIKPYTALKINVTGYGSAEATDSKTFESSFKRANTVFRMMNLSGIQPGMMKLGSELSLEQYESGIPKAGVEIKIYAE